MQQIPWRNGIIRSRRHSTPDEIATDDVVISTQALRAGGFAYMPAKMIHEAWTGDEGATYFITVDGKWDVNFVK